MGLHDLSNGEISQMSRHFLHVLLFALLFVYLGFNPVELHGQAQPAPPPDPDETITLTVFAAASLTDVMTELGAAYQALYPNVTVIFNFAGSSTLATQIMQGAPADVFASANVQQMQAVVDSGDADAATVRIFAHNQLAVIVPADNPAAISDVSDLARDGVLLVLAAPAVPVRVYTDTLLATLQTTYGADYDARVRANLISEETSVRRVVARIALGEADAGIVYQTDVTPDVATDVLLIPLPPGASPVASYPIAPLTTTRHAIAAQSFVAFVLSDAGQTILETWGFCRVIPAVPEATPETTPEPDPTTSPENAPEHAPIQDTLAC